METAQITHASLAYDQRTTAHSLSTFVLCFFAAFAEGCCLQLSGVLAPKFAPALLLSHGQVGLVLTVVNVGLLVGATLGGWLADRNGRKSVLIGSLLLIGLFSIGSALANDFETFFVMRLLTGLGIGGTLPNVISLVAESTDPTARQQRVTLLSSAIPLGGFGAVLTVVLGPSSLGWRTILVSSGLVPLILAVAVFLLLHESEAFEQVKAQRKIQLEPKSNSARAIFGEGRALNTSMLWCAFFFTSVVLYLLINWFPTLMVIKGFTPNHAAIANLAFAAGGIVGALVLGFLSGGADRRLIFFVTFTATGLALLALAVVGKSLIMAMAAAAVVGFFTVGALFLLYGVSPMLYPSNVRATGIGWAVGIGRLGGIVGTGAVSIVMAAGGGPTAVLMSILPGVGIALVAAMVLVWRPTQTQLV